MSVHDSLKEFSAEEYPAEVKRCILELRAQRDRMQEELRKVEQERKKIQNDIRFLTDRLAVVSHEQAQKSQFKLELDKTIEETEDAYHKLIETSKGLYKTIRDTKRSIQNQDTAHSSRVDMKNSGQNQKVLLLDSKNEGPTVAAIVAVDAITPKTTQ